MADDISEQQADTETAATAGPPSPDHADDETEEADSIGYTLPLDQIFEILKNSRRRQTLRYLTDNGGETTLSDVAEYIAAIENDTTERKITSSQRKRVYVGLYQCHLPKMDDMDVVGFNKNRGTIEIGANADQLAPYLDYTESLPWHKLYMAVALVGAGLFVLSIAGGAAIGLTSTVVLAVLLGSMFACAGAQYRARLND